MSTPSSAQPGPRRLEVDPDTGDLKIVFPYDPDLLPVVRALPGRRWRPEGRYWSVGAENAEVAARTLLDYGFEPSAEVEARLGAATERPATPPSEPTLGRGLIPGLPRRYESSARTDAPQIGEGPGDAERPRSLSVGQLNEWVRASCSSRSPPRSGSSVK